LQATQASNQAVVKVPQILEKLEQIEEACSGFGRMTEQFSDFQQTMAQTVEVCKRPPLCHVMVQTVAVNSLAKSVQCELRNSHLDAHPPTKKQIDWKSDNPDGHGFCPGHQAMMHPSTSASTSKQLHVKKLSGLREPVCAQRSSTERSRSCCDIGKLAPEQSSILDRLDQTKLDALPPGESGCAEYERFSRKRLRSPTSLPQVCYTLSYSLLCVSCTKLL
jgi:hypothetical protein